MSIQVPTRNMALSLEEFQNELLPITEAQLYEAKRKGRNQVRGQELAGYFSNSLK